MPEASARHPTHNRPHWIGTRSAPYAPMNAPTNADIISGALANKVDRLFDFACRRAQSPVARKAKLDTASAVGKVIANRAVSAGTTITPPMEVAPMAIPAKTISNHPPINASMLIPA